MSPEPITKATIALNIAARRGDLHANTPAAVELAAECLLAFRESINGYITPALRSRDGSYARESTTGKRGLTVDDIAELMAIEGPYRKVARASVLALLSPFWDIFEAPDSACELSEVGADYIRESADVGEALARGMTGTRILKELGEADEKARKLRAVLRARTDSTKALARVMAPVNGGQQ